MSLNAALATASRALEVFSTGVQVSASNISNASTPGYIRDEIGLSASTPFQRGREIVGSGVEITGVRQALDKYLEHRLHASNSAAQAASARDGIYAQLEFQLRELGDGDLSTRLNSFVSSIHELVNQPEQSPLRGNVLEEGKLVASYITDLRSRVDDLRKTQTTRINDLVTETNSLIDQIADLNKQILTLESNGQLKSEAGGLRTQRYTALNRLSEIIPVTFNEQANGSIDIYSGGNFVLVGDRRQYLTTEAAVDRNVPVQTVTFTVSRSGLADSGGELGGVLEARDSILGGFVDQLDQLTGGLIYEFNRIHSSGEGLEGFQTVTSTNRVTDPAAALSSAGLPFTPGLGSFQLKVVNQQTGIARTQTIQIDLDGLGGNDTTLNGLQTAISSTPGVSATVTTDGRLTITSDAGFEVRFGDDTSGVLASLGINTFFTGSNSSTIRVNETVVANRNLFAAGQGGGLGDNRNAVQLAQALDRPSALLKGSSVSAFYESTVSGVAQGAASERATANGLSAFRDSLKAQREQFSAVSLDEEAVRLIQFQQAYAASARVIRAVDDLFQILVGL